MTWIAEGDVRAFDEIYRRHRRDALAHARSLCATREQAEEVMQEAFVALWRGAHGYRPDLGTVGAWLSRVVRNRAIDAWRRASARPVEVAIPEGGHDRLRGAFAPSPSRPERAAVLARMAALPAAQREAVFLAYFADMTHAEIAAHAEAPLGTIKGRIRLGLNKLRDGYEDVTVAPTRLRPAAPMAGAQRAFKSKPAASELSRRAAA
jgi:RNA polymerase sigma-70 factor (ECF subfamily)